jgi:hypothetical protein
VGARGSIYVLGVCQVSAAPPIEVEQFRMPICSVYASNQVAVTTHVFALVETLFIILQPFDPKEFGKRFALSVDRALNRA